MATLTPIPGTATVTLGGVSLTAMDSGRHWSATVLRRKATSAAFGASVAFARAKQERADRAIEGRAAPRLAPVFAQARRPRRNSPCPGCGRKAKACACQPGA